MGFVESGESIPNRGRHEHNPTDASNPTAWDLGKARESNIALESTSCANHGSTKAARRSMCASEIKSVRNETPALPKRLNVNSSPVGYPCGAHTPPADSSQSDRLPADRFDLSHGGTSVRDSVQIPRRADRPRPDRPGRKPSLPLYIGANSPNALCNRGWNLVFSRPTTGSGPGSFAITRLVEFRAGTRFRPVEASKPGLSFASTV